VDLVRTDTLSVELRLSVRAVLLAPIEVLADRLCVSPGLVQLQERMDHYKKLGLGRFATRKELEEYSMMPIVQYIGMMAGVRLDETGRNIVLRLGCTPMWYLNGMPLRFEAGESIDQIVSMYDLEAIEVYKGAASLPPEYSGSTGQCGAVGLWTRR
ncbi:MAG: TonB-dependent receptor, partial [Longimicrobiales bacterium]